MITTITMMMTTLARATITLSGVTASSSRNGDGFNYKMQIHPSLVFSFLPILTNDDDKDKDTQTNTNTETITIFFLPPLGPSTSSSFPYLLI